MCCTITSEGTAACLSQCWSHFRHKPVSRFHQRTFNWADRIVCLPISKVNERSGVRVLYLQLPFEVCTLTHRVDSTNCKAYQASALMRQLISAVFSHNLGDVAWKQHCKENNTVALTRNPSNPELPVGSFQHHSNRKWTSIETHVTE